MCKVFSDTVQIRSRHGRHSDTHSEQLSDIVQIRSKHGRHSDAHSEQLSDTVQIRPRHGYHSDTHSGLTFKIHFRYAPDTDAILIFTQNNFQIQFRYAPSTDAILLFIHSDSAFRYIPDTPQTQLPFCHSFKIYPQHTVALYTDVSMLPIHNTDTLQIRQSFWYSFKDQIQLQLRYAPDTDAILILIQFQLTVQQSFLDGIYKPISNNFLSSLWMTSLSPFPRPSHHRVQISGHSSVQSSSTFESRTTKLANLTH